MRLTCPSCGAQYEVPDDVIPDEGRDVQCSNCGKTWFQAKGTEDSPEAVAAAEAAPKDAVWHPEVDSDGDDGPSVNQDAAPGKTPPPAPPKRKELDPAVAGILREEAELEARAREAEADVLEDQPDLGLQEPEDEAAKRARQAQDRMRKLRGDPPDPSIAAAATGAVVDTRPQSRSDMLPDVEEINQTLRASTERREVRTVQGDLEDDDEPNGGFGRGFIFTALIFVIATAVYIFGPQLAESFPGLAGPMEMYVATVDQARAWLDTQIDSIRAMIGGDSA
ncbi:zinc-ribbon domain-containing protein [Marivita hallyeonensis]|uniref:MJ0042 family finger-like domain-containing protein n=1 Tax=Marivita hallyeonensis TaxID=996342 RepID=A0A1M5WUB1_9RHOB|nr:zinc-ribbon domain-containing protein [Marivita hallyeonensis]SHH91177.1 MJ0042 family finger-like domain-containing protein [Marivita hallyeonensis]